MSLTQSTANDEPNTQPIDDIQFSSQSQCSQSQCSQNSPQPWGQLVPYKNPSPNGRGILDVPLNSSDNKDDSNSEKTRIVLEMTNMIKDEYKVGRISDMDIILSTENINPRFIHVISKVQFVITREFVTAKNDYVAILHDKSSNGTFVNGKLIGNGNRVVLTHNDTISLAKADLKVYNFILAKNPHLELPADLSTNYIGLRKLGSGVCGEVKLIFSRKKFCALALKTISKRKGPTVSIDKDLLNDPNKIMNEVNILRALRHPNIIKMYDVINSPLDVYIMLEVMQGGELFDRVKMCGGLSEAVGKFHFYQIASAVAYLHSQGITHRDLKPENILLLNDDEYTICKVADFGMSKLVDSATMLKTFCGTPLYVAPEILNTQGRGKYTSQVDVWSLGVILYVMLSSYVPFSSTPNTTLYETIKKGRFKFPYEKFQDKSRSVIRLISTMLRVNPNERRPIQQVMSSSWFHDDSMKLNVKETLKFCSRKSDENKNPNVDSGIGAMEHENQQHDFDLPHLKAKRPRNQ